MALSVLLVFAIFIMALVLFGLCAELVHQSTLP
jgi:hypothetical protein